MWGCGPKSSDSGSDLWRTLIQTVMRRISWTTKKTSASQEGRFPVTQLGGQAWLLRYGPGNRGIMFRLPCAQADNGIHSASFTGGFSQGVKWQRKSWPLISFQQRCWKWEDLYIHLFIRLHDIHRDFAFPCVQTLHQISGHLLHFSTFRLHCNNKLALESNSYTYQTPGYENLISSVTACDIYIEYDNAFDHCEKNCCLYLPVRVKCV